MFPDNLKKAEDFISGSFKSLGYTVSKQEYKVWGKTFRNIYRHYHKHSDTIDKLDFLKMSVVVQQLNQGIARLSNEKI